MIYLCIKYNLYNASTCRVLLHMLCYHYAGVHWKCIMCIFCITIQLYTNVILTLYCVHTIFDGIMCTYRVHFLVQLGYTCIMCIFRITVQLYTNVILTLYCVHTIFDGIMCTYRVHFLVQLGYTCIMCIFRITVQLYTNVILVWCLSANCTVTSVCIHVWRDG